MNLLSLFLFSLLATLDSLTTKVAFESKKKLHFTESELSIAVFKINKSGM